MMISNFKKIALLFASAFVWLSGYCVPAMPGLLRAMQPDGSTVSIYLQGDEYNSSAYSSDGYLLTSDDEGYYVFATLDKEGLPVATDMREINPEMRSEAVNARLRAIDKQKVIEAWARQQEKAEGMMRRGGPGLSKTRFPSLGEQRALVILVEFQNRSFFVENPNDYFTRMLNEEGFSDDDGTGSARDFFLQGSAGNFSPHFDVYGPVLLPEDGQYYGENIGGRQDANVSHMIIQACDLLDDTVDFSIYDNDKDGYIDNVYVFYAGYGEADGGGSNTIWPHSYDIIYPLHFYDGVKLEHYACSNEYQAYYKKPVGIGTFCHEFSHVLGLPDLYSTNYGRVFGPDSWDLEASGSYNNNTRTPPTFSAFERYALDWLQPVTLEPGEYELPHILDSNLAYIVPTSKRNEYFILENRQQAGFDSFIPGHGMLVWHIDYNYNIWLANSVNNNPDHQYVDIVEADNILTSATRDGDTFPGASNVTEFSCQTTPALRSWADKDLLLRIYDIRETADGIIRFKVEGCEESSVGGLVVDDMPLRIVGHTVVPLRDDLVVYDIHGAKVGAGGCGEITLPAGIYIAVAEGKARKFVIH